jgi:hypothetical protein
MNVGAKTARLSFLYRQFIDFLPRDLVAVKKGPAPPFSLNATEHPPAQRRFTFGLYPANPAGGHGRGLDWCGFK